MARDRREVLLAGAGLLAAPALLARGAGAATPRGWPPRTVTIVVPYAPGGGTDIFARTIAEGMRADLEQTVVVENRAGANGVVGAEYVSRAEPDGCTLAVCTGAHVINRYSMPSIPFDPVADFAPVALLSSFPLVLAANVKTPWRDLRGLVAAAKEKPGSLTFGTTEAATSYAGNAFARQMGIEMVEVPYRGSGPQLNDLIAGHLPLAITSTVSILPFVQSGNARVLGVTSSTRAALLPDVPTFAEAGVPGYEFTGHYGMYGPKALAPELRERLYASVQSAMRAPAINRKLAETGADLKTLGPAAFGDFLRGDNQRWAAAARDGLIAVQR